MPYLCSSGWALVVGFACMCSAPYGRKRRPRSAGIIFPVRVAQTEPERRESTEGAVDGSRMVSVEIARKKLLMSSERRCVVYGGAAAKDRSLSPDGTDF